MITWKEMNDNTGKLYSSGDILACFLGIVYGVFSLGLAAPNVQSLTEGRVAGKMAFDVIDRLPSIPLNDPNALKVDPKKVQGNIEFRNVTFTYPTRPGQKILDNFSAVFEQGKTTALVGASGSGKSTIIQLIERFYDPDFGDVIIDGRNLRQINLKSLRQCIGYVG